MPAHIFFRPRKPRRGHVRPSKCVRGDGKSKRRYTEAAAAQAVTEVEQRSPDYVLEHYRCPECGWWHLGNRKVNGLQVPWTHKIVHRETAWLIELGERATAHLLAKGSRPQR